MSKLDSLKDQRRLYVEERNARSKLGADLLSLIKTKWLKEGDNNDG